MAQLGRSLVGIVVGVVLVGLVIGLGAVAGSSSETAPPVEILPGVAGITVDGVAIVTVRDDDGVRAFLAGDRRREPLEFCEASQVLTTSAGGSVFTLTGEKLAGPSPNVRLDQVLVTPTDDPDLFVVRADDVIDGDTYRGASSNGPWLPRLGDEWPDRFGTTVGYCPPPEYLP